MPRPTGGVSYGTGVPVEGTGVVPGHWEQFPRAPRCEGQSGRGSGEAGEVTVSPSARGVFGLWREEGLVKALGNRGQSAE